MKRATTAFILILILILVILLFAAADRLLPGGGSVNSLWSETSSAPTPASSAVPKIEAGIDSIDKYGNLTLTVGPQRLQERGYEPGDLVFITIGDTEVLMPIGTSYNDVDAGEPVCVFKAARGFHRAEVVLAINTGNFASTLNIAKIRNIEEEPGFEIVFSEGFDAGTMVSLSMAEKQGYAEEFQLHQITGTRTNWRRDYAELSDAEYANFRAVNTTGIGTDTLFRSSSPIDPSLNRSWEADELIRDSLIRTVVNMADSEETMRAYPFYFSTNYSHCDIIALNMGIDFQSGDFKEKLAKGFRFMAEHEGPYLIHCLEGKDRTGFAAAILECLMGAGPDEIVRDYMLTYTNYYGTKPGSEQYAWIAASNIQRQLCNAFGIPAFYGEGVDLSKCASDYLEELGLTGQEIQALRTNLGKEYGGLG